MTSYAGHEANEGFGKVRNGTAYATGRKESPDSQRAAAEAAMPGRDCVKQTSDYPAIYVAASFDCASGRTQVAETFRD